jgi:hypothetical protein
MSCEVFGSFDLLEFLWRVLAGMVGGLVTAGLFWLYGWWNVRHKFKRLQGIYEFVNRDGTQSGKSSDPAAEPFHVILRRKTTSSPATGCSTPKSSLPQRETHAQ